MIEEKDSRMFLEEDSGGDGGGADTGSRGAAVFEGGQEAPAAAPEAPQQAPGERGEPRGPTVDARQLATEFGQVIGQHFKGSAEGDDGRGGQEAPQCLGTEPGVADKVR